MRTHSGGTTRIFVSALALAALLIGGLAILAPTSSFAYGGAGPQVEGPATYEPYDVSQLDYSVRTAVVEARAAAERGRDYATRARNGETKGVGSSVGPTGNHYDGQTGETGSMVEGMITMPDGVTYLGQFISGDPTHYRGYGVYRFANGFVFEGQWANDQYNGLGVYWNAKGGVDSVGIWRDNTLVTSLAH